MAEALALVGVALPPPPPPSPSPPPPPAVADTLAEAHEAVPLTLGEGEGLRVLALAPGLRVAGPADTDSVPCVALAVPLGTEALKTAVPEAVLQALTVKVGVAPALRVPVVLLEGQADPVAQVLSVALPLPVALPVAVGVPLHVEQ